MPIEVWMLRHGEAVPHGARPDPQRELTARGEEQARRAGRAFERLGVAFAACYTSPKVRARDTARLACGPLGLEPVEVGALAGGFDLDDLRELLLGHADGERILLAGHNPDFPQLVRDLAGARAPIKKGGVAVLAVDGRRGDLLALLRPAELAKIAE